MARLAISCALLMFSLALAEASVYQTIITTTEFDEPNPSQSERCRTQLKGMRQYCDYYMLWPRTPSTVDQGCCQDLRQVNDPKCRCEALRQRVPGYAQQQLQEASSKVKSMADTCRMPELQSCQIRAQQGS
ncbi:hypothetical protein FRX31_021887 [Thalictrum thalictroides]|uniref:Bifunctional inhibitor/plant lipid transfer protein/seed storage helical domain-containing protein n=1 Tax=Thalictrum thalictroides TaxID=46969 RepID=A0A7J6VUY8_THATH|nr:hypothetical protein FRX31_021887 [Thalictrum thalictroides]